MSTLPPLDQELTELLERHRRLDREAALITRRAEADANRWHDDDDDAITLSSRAPRSPSSPGRYATDSYSSRRSSGSGDKE
ncbi:unnamed protein product, partial [Ectocarpus sp. 12 AP-2014]